MQLTPSVLKLLQRMADGEYHSGEALGETLGVSRAAVWKTLEGLQPLGLDILRTRGRGYCLQGGIDFLSQDGIRAALNQEAVTALGELSVLTEVGSTNQHLLDQVNAATTPVHGATCLAEMQNAGRGRRGRVWQSPFAKNIYMSLAWSFNQGVAAMEGLSLVVGLAVVRALEDLFISGVSLKWPNDIFHGEKKLGGVLIEITGDVTGQCHAVIGLGLNVYAREEHMAGVDQPWASIQQIAESVPSRNQLAATVLNRLIGMLGEFGRTGFPAFRADWEAHCEHIGLSVRLETNSGFEMGEMIGVDDAGSLRLRINGEEKSFLGGEVSLRPVL